MIVTPLQRHQLRQRLKIARVVVVIAWVLFIMPVGIWIWKFSRIGSDPGGMAGMGYVLGLFVWFPAFLVPLIWVALAINRKRRLEQELAELEKMFRPPVG